MQYVEYKIYTHSYDHFSSSGFFERRGQLARKERRTKSSWCGKLCGSILNPAETNKIEDIDTGDREFCAFANTKESRFYPPRAFWTP